ncbi:hypothetical protein IFM5058_03323 [Aspergillus udagawae]|nr:hypothetical protein IFM5058_03323 [Aspergillus udagawae]
MPTYTLSGSQLEKLDNSRRAQRNPRKYLQERCHIILLPYLEAAVERFEKARTVAGTYELGSGTAKVKDMYHPSKMETRRLIAWSDHTITFINPEGQRRNLLAVVVAKERRGDAYNPLLAHIGIVHRNRKERGEKNSVVYGIATDGFNFKIVKIDNKSKLFESCLYSFDEEWGFFLKYLDDILAEAPKQCEE